MSRRPHRRVFLAQSFSETDAEYRERHDAELAEVRAERQEERRKQAEDDADYLAGIQEYIAKQKAAGLPIELSSHARYFLSKRTYNPRSPIYPGKQFFRPANPDDPRSIPSEPVTVIARATKASSMTEVVVYHGKKRRRSGEEIAESPAPAERQFSYSNGMWIMRCFCGNEYEAKTTDLNRLEPWALHCPGCTLPRKHRNLGFGTRPGASRHIGQTYGRLTVVEWVERAGWRCECDCGTDDLVPRSRDLFRRGSEPCPHV